MTVAFFGNKSTFAESRSSIRPRQSNSRQLTLTAGESGYEDNLVLVRQRRAQRCQVANIIFVNEYLNVAEQVVGIVQELCLQRREVPHETRDRFSHGPGVHAMGMAAAGVLTEHRGDADVDRSRGVHAGFRRVAERAAEDIATVPAAKMRRG